MSLRGSALTKRETSNVGANVGGDARGGGGNKAIGGGVGEMGSRKRQRTAKSREASNWGTQLLCCP